MNSEQYSPLSVQVMILGRIVDVSGIEYGVKRDIQKKYRLGDSNPAAIIKGVKDSTGKVMFLHQELISMQDVLPKGADITDIKGINILVSYLDQNLMTKVDRLENVVFEGIDKAFKAEDPNFDFEVPIHIGRIVYNA
jgi:hypothetical protein